MDMQYMSTVINQGFPYILSLKVQLDHLSPGPLPPDKENVSAILPNSDIHPKELTSQPKHGEKAQDATCSTKKIHYFQVTRTHHGERKT